MIETTLDASSDVEEETILSPGRADGESDTEVNITDAARKKAEELGVEPLEVKGTGSGGKILVRDVQKAAGNV